jgi:hypothetical protein
MSVVWEHYLVFEDLGVADDLCAFLSLSAPPAAAAAPAAAAPMEEDEPVLTVSQYIHQNVRDGIWSVCVGLLMCIQHRLFGNLEHRIPAPDGGAPLTGIIFSNNPQVDSGALIKFFSLFSSSRALWKASVLRGVSHPALNGPAYAFVSTMLDDLRAPLNRFENTFIGDFLETVLTGTDCWYASEVRVIYDTVDDDARSLGFGEADRGFFG